MPFLGCLASVLYGLFMATPPPELFEESDKAGHLIAFVALTSTALLCFPRKSSGLVFVFMLSFAAGSEYLQATLQPQRFFSEQDIYANIGGVVITGTVWILYYLIVLKQQNNQPSEINNI